MKPSSIYQDAEMTLRFDNIAVYLGLKNRTEVQRYMLAVTEKHLKRVSVSFTDNIEYMRKDLEGE